MNNSLQLITCPFSSTIYVFLPAGENLAKVGILAVSVNKISNFEVEPNNGTPCLVANNAYQHRIAKLLINPISDCSDSAEDNEGFVTVAYMLVCCKYSVSWYSINVRKKSDRSSSRIPAVKCIGSKWFRSSAVVHACWSPHLVEESAVLLENGEIFLFDLNSCSRNNKVAGKKLCIVWDTVGDECMKSGDGNVWVGCEFSWHPRILVVAHSSRLFLVDMRSGDCKVRSLLSIEKVSTMKNDGFIALAMAGTDRFYFAIASKELLLLCDARIPKRPLLRWVHGLDSPNHITFLQLSALRSNSSEEMYNWASKCGHCILLGSFWDGEFCIFCYGPDYGKATCLSKLSEVNNHFFAWGLPSDISLSGRGCHCGTCLVKEESCKEALHKWIDWRQKKELVMGFGFVEQEISSRLGEPDNFGGFHLIRLMSSGKLEVQKYCASWRLEHISEKAHRESKTFVEYYDFYDIGELKYDFPKRFRFLMLDQMKRYLDNDNAAADYECTDFDDCAVNLGDDTDNLFDEVPETKYSPYHLKTPVQANIPGLNQSNTRSNPEKSAPVTSTNQSSAYNVKKEEAAGLELFDEGCPYDLKFNDHGIELGQQGLQICNLLVAHKLKFQKGFKLREEF